MCRVPKFTVLLVVGALSGSYASAQTQPCWIVGNNGTNSMSRVQNGQVTAQWNRNGNEFGLAVNNTVRPICYFAGTSYEYTLDGQLTGTTYENDLGDTWFWDATTDGTYNYTISTNTWDVYRFDANWSNPTVLFTAPAGSSGIGWDHDGNNLWVFNFINQGVTEYTPGGQVIGSFTSQSSRRVGYGLGFENSTNTIWLVNYDNTTFVPKLTQYSTNGGWRLKSHTSSHY